MTIHYTTRPKTFSELVDSCRGMMERKREVSIDGGQVPIEECVVITTESMLDTLEQIERIQFSLWEQSEVNKSIQSLFYYLFKHLGLPCEGMMDEDEEYYDETDDGYELYDEDF